MNAPFISTIFLALIFLSAGWTVVTLVSLPFFFKLRKRIPFAWEPLPVSILKPVKGVDDGAYENFRSFCELDYPDYEIIFAVKDWQDKAVPLILKIIEEYPEREIQLVVSTKRWGFNQKVNNLQNAFENARHPLIVINDSDIRVTSDYLKKLIPWLSRKKVGLVTCMWTVRGAQDWGAALEAVSINSTVFSAFAVSALLRQLKGGIGATIAIPRKVLKEVGGFVAVADNVCDDGMLGKKVLGAGYRLFLSPYLPRVILHRQKLKTYVRRYSRWLITIRHVYPVEYFATGLGFFGSLCAFLYFISDISLWRGLVLAMSLVLRFGGAFLYNVFYIKDRGTLKYSWLLPMWDLIVPIYWFHAWFVNKVNWRGNRFTLGPSGWILKMEEMAAKSQT